MFESLISNLIAELEDQLGPFFQGGYTDGFSETVGFNNDKPYYFWIEDVDPLKYSSVSNGENKFAPTTFTKEFRLVIQFKNPDNKELIIKKVLWSLNKFSANQIRFNESSHIIQSVVSKQKAKIDIPLMLFQFTLKRSIVVNECKEVISDYGC